MVCDLNRLRTPTLSIPVASARVVAVRQLIGHHRHDDLITILDSGCDWSVIALGWHILHDYNELFSCQGAFFTENEASCRLVDAASVFYFPGTAIPPILVHVHRVLHHDDLRQTETLLDPLQLQAASWRRLDSFNVQIL